MKFKTRLKNELETEVTVGYKYIAGFRGTRNSMGVPLEPDDEPEIRILYVETKDNEDILWALTDTELEYIEEKCWKNYNHQR